MGGEWGCQAKKLMDGEDKDSGGDQEPDRRMNGLYRRKITKEKLKEKQKSGV